MALHWTWIPLRSIPASQICRPAAKCLALSRADLPYLWLRENRSAWLLIPPAASLSLFVWLLCLHPTATGRIYAAYRTKQRRCRGKQMKAREIMDTTFQTLRPEDSISKAVQRFSEISRAVDRKMFGLMVIDASDQLLGMLSMYDILQFIQPKHIHIWGEMEDLDPDVLFEKTLEKVKNIQVGDIMTTDVVTVKPETHILLIVDIMLKKHIRRLPVVENEKVVGIVYVSDVFYQLMNKLV